MQQEKQNHRHGVEHRRKVRRGVEQVAVGVVQPQEEKAYGSNDPACCTVYGLRRNKFAWQ